MSVTTNQPNVCFFAFVIATVPMFKQTIATPWFYFHGSTILSCGKLCWPLSKAATSSSSVPPTLNGVDSMDSVTIGGTWETKSVFPAIPLSQAWPNIILDTPAIPSHVQRDERFFFPWQALLFNNLYHSMKVWCAISRSAGGCYLSCAWHSVNHSVTRLSNLSPGVGICLERIFESRIISWMLHRIMGRAGTRLYVVRFFSGFRQKLMSAGAIDYRASRLTRKFLSPNQRHGLNRERRTFQRR